MRVKIKLDQWNIQSEMTMEVDQTKFTEDMASEINIFFGGSTTRLNDNDNDPVKAALRLIAAESFFIVARNDLLDGEYIERKFDWSKDEGIEGFYSFKDMGITITEIESWHLTHDETEIVSITNDAREK